MLFLSFIRWPTQSKYSESSQLTLHLCQRWSQGQICKAKTVAMTLEVKAEAKAKCIDTIHPRSKLYVLVKARTSKQRPKPGQRPSRPRTWFLSAKILEAPACSRGLHHWFVQKLLCIGEIRVEQALAQRMKTKQVPSYDVLSKMYWWWIRISLSL